MFNCKRQNYQSQIEIDQSKEFRDELLSGAQSPALWAPRLRTMTEAWQNKHKATQ